MNTIGATAVAVLPICYLCSKKGSSLVKHSLVACLWIVFLGIPCLNQSEMEIRSSVTMITSVLSFIMPLKLTQLILCPYREKDDLGASKKSDGDKLNNISTDENMSWRGFLSFVGSFFYYMIPISKTKPPFPTWQALLKQNAKYMVIILIKIIITPLFGLALRRLADKYPYPSLRQEPVAYMKMEILFTLEVIGMAWTNDSQCVIVNLLSGGRLQMLHMHNFPFLSRSLRDLWGRRYNLLISTLLKETVFIPAQNSYGCSKQVASILAFTTSGVLHSWVAHFTFGGGVGRASLFFLLQAIWINRVEQKEWYRNSVPSIWKAVSPVLYFYATACLYVGLFVEAMPEWLDKNAGAVPDVPVLQDVTRSIGVAIGLIQE